MNPQILHLMSVAAAYIQKGKLDDAERLLKQVIKVAPKHSEALRLLGVCLAMRRDLQAALKMMDSAIKIDPKNYLAFSNKGNILKDLFQYKAALESYDKAIALQPNYAEAHNNKGNLLQNMNQPEAALASYERAIELQPNYSDAYSNAGDTLRKINSLDKALEAFEKAIEFAGGSDVILGAYINLKMQQCDWVGIEGYLNTLQTGEIKRKDKFYPFNLLAVCEDPFLIKQITQDYMAAVHPPKGDLGDVAKHERNEKIRIGYFSPDFRNHPVSFLMADVIEHHDKSKFELIAFSIGQGTQDEMRNRLESSFDQFIEVFSKSEKEIAQIARELKIDIAVDLGGLTQDTRPSIFAFRAAPIQIGYIGYLSTMAASYMDYIIADKTIIPDELQLAYTEKIIYLPSYQANDSKRPNPQKVFTREELGLPSKGFVFCNFNNSFKLTPSVFDGWAKILKKVEGSVLYLYAANETVSTNLSSEIEKRGVDRKRLIFGDCLSRESYLARYKVADLFLDTTPYNAGTTASDALWMGLPVLTLLGRSFSARMGASLLSAIGLPELITYSQSEYESLSIELAHDPMRMAQIKNTLKQNIETTPLFNSQLFTQNLELVYKKVYDRYQNGLPPEHII